MRPDLLNLSDRDLVAEIHRREARGREDDPALLRVRAHRTVLSRAAWDAFAGELSCDRGPMAQTGVMVFPLDDDLARRLMAALSESPKAKMRREDFALGYVNTAAAQCDYLNECNEYRTLTPHTHELLREFLSVAGPILEASIGHPFRIASMRQFQLVPNRVLADRHVDGWPVSLRKLFILPQGCGKRSSTTWFRQRNGVEMTLESEKPIWVVFENSVVEHAPISGVALRPTIEFDIVPARETSLVPFYAGLAGWYPTFPTEAGLLEGTRAAVGNYLAEPPPPAKSWLDRVRDLGRRIGSGRA